MEDRENFDRGMDSVSDDVNKIQKMKNLIDKADAVWSAIIALSNVFDDPETKKIYQELCKQDVEAGNDSLEGQFLMCSGSAESNLREGLRDFNLSFDDREEADY